MSKSRQQTHKAATRRLDFATIRPMRLLPAPPNLSAATSGLGLGTRTQTSTKTTTIKG